MDDLIAIQWKYKNAQMRALSSLNSIRIDINLSEFPECTETQAGECPRIVALFLSEFLILKGVDKHGVPIEIDLALPNELNDGVIVSSAPKKSVRRILNWHERIDAFVEDNALSILLYKKVPQLTGFRDGSKWFPDDFRAWIHEQARLQGRLPEPDDPE